MNRHILAIALLIAAGPLVFAQGQFMGIGVPYTYLSDASADASIVVGTFGNYGPAWRWTASTGVVNIGGVGFKAAISRDGKTIVSNAKDASGVSSAAIWQDGVNWKTLGGVPGGEAIDNNLSTAYSVSADGSVVVGLAWVANARAHGFRWDAHNGMVDLGSLQGRDSRANIVSADGNIVFGWDANPEAISPYTIPGGERPGGRESSCSFIPSVGLAKRRRRISTARSGSALAIQQPLVTHTK